ncbi:MAG: Hsp20/alpha crystallin family protein [Proteobacteria bacterium]|nr:Hsp20/alpha crystallin family protein [Pseudomonadota bacterium]
MNENQAVSQDQPTEPVRQLPVITPAVDILENEREILLHADLPGVLKDDINIHIDNGKMTLSGRRRLQMTGATAWREFADAEFRRIFAVPQNIDVGQVHADLKEGVLRLHLPKSESAKPRRIEITAG